MRARRAGGCSFPSDPALDWARATPMWSSAFDPAVLKVRAETCDRDAPFSLDLRSHLARVLVGERCEHVLIALNSWPLRLDVVAGSLLAGPARLEPAISLGAHFGSRVAALRRLDSLLRGVSAAPGPDPRLARLILALRALDARRDRASLRELALSLYPDCTWPGDGDCVKSRVRRLIALAEDMSRAGHAAVLRGWPRRDSKRPDR